jgi:hypothetical protein
MRPIKQIRSESEPFRHWLIDCERTARVVRETPVVAPPPESEVWEARYANDCEYGKRTTRKFADIPRVSPYFNWLLGKEWLDDWRRLTGIDDLRPDETLHGGGLHVTQAGGWLNTHLDYARHPILEGMERRLSVVLFLNPEWREEWGGALKLCDQAGNVVRRCFPAPGRIVAFENSDLSYHGTEELSADAPERLTAAVFLVAPSRSWASRRRALFIPNRSPALKVSRPSVRE